MSKPHPLTPYKKRWLQMPASRGFGILASTLPSHAHGREEETQSAACIRDIWVSIGM